MSADARLVIPAVVGAILVGILLGLPELLSSVTMSLWVTVGVVISVAIVSPKWKEALATVAVTAVASAALLTSAFLHTSARSPAVLLEAAQSGRFVHIVAVMDVEVVGGVHPRHTAITIKEATVGQATLHGLSIPALLFGSAPQAGVGTRIAVSGTLAGTKAGDRTAYLVFARGSPRVIAASPWFLDWSNGLRTTFRTAAGALPGDGGALLPGLAIGDTRSVSESLDNAMITTSLSHLTAVSGANCAVVVGLIMLLGGALGVSRTVRIASAISVLAGFVVLVTPDASVLRAAVMAALVLFAVASGRPTRGVPVLSFAVIVLLAVDPWLSRDFGFILSVLATAGLLVLAGPLARVLSRWLPTPLAILISIPLAAQLACQPVLILLNPVIPVYGVLANLLAEPAAPIATVLGLIACVTLPFVPAVGNVVVSLAWVPSSWIAAIARVLSEAPGAQAPWLPGAFGTITVAVLIVLVLIAVLRKRSRATKIVSAVLLVSLASYVGAVAGAGLGQMRSIPRSWQIAACDVGQGDGVFIRSLDQVALIDTGPEPEALSQCMNILGIERIHLLILSHYDLDHVGGTRAVLGRVDRALVGPAADNDDRVLRDTLQRAGAAVSQVFRGDHGSLGELSWEILWPPSRKGASEPGNAASVAVRFTGAGQCSGGCLSSVFLGDLGKESQQRMLGAAHPSPVDVVKVAHHGSTDQWPGLYEKLQARVGIVSVGSENTYGHPTDRLLGMLENVGTEIARTDLEGMILIFPSPEGRIVVWTEHAPGRDVGTH